MSGNRQRLREEVRDVLQAWNVLDDELPLPYSITQTVKPHVCGLRHLGDDGVLGEFNSALIVTVPWGWGLRVPHVGKDAALFRGDSSCGIGAPVFCLAAERADDRDAG